MAHQKPDPNISSLETLNTSAPGAEHPPCTDVRIKTEPVEEEATYASALDPASVTSAEVKREVRATRASRGVTRRTNADSQGGVSNEQPGAAESQSDGGLLAGVKLETNVESQGCGLGENSVAGPSENPSDYRPEVDVKQEANLDEGQMNETTTAGQSANQSGSGFVADVKQERKEEDKRGELTDNTPQAGQRKVEGGPAVRVKQEKIDGSDIGGDSTVVMRGDDFVVERVHSDEEGEEDCKHSAQGRSFPANVAGPSRSVRPRSGNTSLPSDDESLVDENGEATDESSSNSASSCDEIMERASLEPTASSHPGPATTRQTDSPAASQRKRRLPEEACPRPAKGRRTMQLATRDVERVQLEQEKQRLEVEILERTGDELQAEVLELEVEEGSDDEEAVVYSESDSDFDDSDEEQDVADDQLGETRDSNDSDQCSIEMLTQRVLRQRRSTLPRPSMSAEPSSTCSQSAVEDLSSDNVDDDDDDDDYVVDDDHDHTDDDDDDDGHMWVHNTRNYPRIVPFTGEPGLQVEMSAEATPLDFYQLIVDEDLMKLMRRETNRYAKTTIAKRMRQPETVSPRSFWRAWKPVTGDEMRKFLAILIHMGLIHLPDITDYWSKDPAVYTTFARSLMCRDRFRAILAFFHLNDNATYVSPRWPNHDPLHKVRPLLDHLNAKFSSLYQPDEDICLHEALCPWRGRCQPRVHTRDKTGKKGIKLHQLCESKSGYIWQLEVMSKAAGVNSAPKDVCLRLVDPLLNKGHTLYVGDNYCSPQLAASLIAKGTKLEGTVCPDRAGLPRALMVQRMSKGAMDYRRRGKLLVIRWRDKREVTIITTKHLPDWVDAQSRSAKPTAVADHAKKMDGVDRSDQTQTYNPMHERAVKWWKKLACHLLTLAMTQALCLFNLNQRQHGRRPWQICKFIRSVCNALPKTTSEQEEEEVPRFFAPPGVVDPLHGQHTMEMLRDARGRKKYRNCVVCYHGQRKAGQAWLKVRGQRKQTPYLCVQCQKALCVDPCMRIYHSAEYHAK